MQDTTNYAYIFTDHEYTSLNLTSKYGIYLFVISHFRFQINDEIIR